MMPTFKSGSKELSEYVHALNLHNAAIRTFEGVREMYRAKKVDMDTFLAAKVVYDAATAQFDAAWIKEETKES